MWAIATNALNFRAAKADAEALLRMHRTDIDLARVRKVLEHPREMAEEPESSRRLSVIDRPRRRASKKRSPSRR